MDISSDYRDLFKTFNRHKVRYLVVGAYAVIFYTEPRYTKDLDVWVEPDEANAKRVYEALKDFGAPIKGVSWKTFMGKDLFYQIGIVPVRIDIMMGLGNIDFADAWQRRQKTKYGGIPIGIIGLKELIRSKKAARRGQDTIDLELLNMVAKKSGKRN